MFFILTPVVTEYQICNLCSLYLYWYIGQILNMTLILYQSQTLWPKSMPLVFPNLDFGIHLFRFRFQGLFGSLFCLCTLIFMGSKCMWTCQLCISTEIDKEFYRKFCLWYLSNDCWMEFIITTQFDIRLCIRYKGRLTTGVLPVTTYMFVL